MYQANLLHLVFDAIAALAQGLASSPEYASLLEQAIAAARLKAERAMPFPPSDLPLAIATALEAPEDTRLLCGALGASLWAGADILDDLADNDPLSWAGSSDPRAILVATNLLATFPHLLLDGPLAAELSAEQRARISASIARATFAMSQGQHRDLSGAPQGVQDYLNTIQEKTGAEMALVASLPALALGRPAGEVAGWEAFGKAYGMLVQVYTDTCDIIGEEPSRDLLAGRKTAPVVYALVALQGDEKVHFEHLLEEAAGGSASAAKEAAAVAIDAGAIRAGLTLAAYLRQKAVAATPTRIDEFHECAELVRLIRDVLPNPHQQGV